MTKSAQKKAVQFTRMCKFWRTNECKMGAECTFAHGSSELRPSPKPCFEFSKNGSCARGELCRFVHELGGSQSPSSVGVLRAPARVGLQIVESTVEAGLEGGGCLETLQHSNVSAFRPPPGLSPQRLAVPEAPELPSSRRSSLAEIPLPLKLCSWERGDLSPDDATIATQSTASICFSTTSTSFWL